MSAAASVTTPARFRGVFRQDADARAVYSESAGIFRIEPLAVAVPVDSDDLTALLDWARSEGVTLVPRGSGSSMAAGATGPGVIVDLSRWTDIDLAAVSDRRMIVGAGAICADVDLAARRSQLRFPVEPSSAAFCTIGGMTATNAAGASSLAFGSMRDWVTGIECLFADGTRKWIRRGDRDRGPGPIAGLSPLLSDSRMADAFARAQHAGVRKNSSGYATARFAETHDPVDLLVGSEGTLALFLRIELRMAPIPGAAASVMGTFPSLAAATDAAIRARDAGAVACELLDRTFLEFVGAASGKPIDQATEAILLADAEGLTPADARETATTIATGFTRAGASETRLATEAAERDALWSLRHAASPTLARLSAKLRSMQFIEDGAVPPDRLADYVTGVRAALQRQQLRGVIFGHAGDAHVHVNPLVDVHAPGWRAKVAAVLDEVTALVASLGGTLSGEHGDGRLRTPLLDRVWSRASLDAFAAVKRTFDPTGLLNHGVKTDPEASSPAVKYDPALAPLPSAANRALDEVERSRIYSAYRLELLERG